MKRTSGTVVAWLLTGVHYFYQYALRTTPSVMMPQLSEGFAARSLGAASVLGVFYYRYSGGTATGVINFVIFTLSAALGPVSAWSLQKVSGGGQIGLQHYITTFQPLLYGVGLANALNFLLKETGPASVRLSKARTAEIGRTV
jgi:hypothetical protein